MNPIVIGGLSIEFLHSKSDTSGGLDMFRMTVKPQAKVPLPHYHETWDEAVYGLAGELVFRIDGVDHLITPDRSAFIPRGIVHSFRNDGEKEAVVLNILTPGVLGVDYFVELAELAAAGPPEPTRVREIMSRYGLVPVMD